MMIPAQTTDTPYWIRALALGLGFFKLMQLAVQLVVRLRHTLQAW